jgi:hypothetical protein
MWDEVWTDERRRIDEGMTKERNGSKWQAGFAGSGLEMRGKRKSEWIYGYTTFILFCIVIKKM